MLNKYDHEGQYSISYAPAPACTVITTVYKYPFVTTKKIDFCYK